MERQCLGETALEMWKTRLKCLHRTSLHCHKESRAAGTPMSKSDQLHLVGMSLGEKQEGEMLHYFLLRGRRYFPQNKLHYSRKIIWRYKIDRAPQMIFKFPLSLHFFPDIYVMGLFSWVGLSQQWPQQGSG